ncbi:MAG TPA: ATP-grasp domain-containing protein [Patescibacteria group bacterium]|nr:ATP-grasp domain-containing protein [Patescibacteria group bacterium]
MTPATRHMRVVVFEYFSARRAGSDPAALRRAGGAMLRAVRQDLAALPYVGVAVVPPSARPSATLRRMLRDADAALIVAPESGGILVRLLRVAVGEGVALLGPGPRAARLAGDKLATIRLLERAGVPVTASSTVPARFEARLLRRRPPFVLKPRHGCGSEGVSLVRIADDLDGAVRRARAAAGGGGLLVEDYLSGVPASVSILVAPRGPGVHAGREGRGREGRRRIRVLALGRQRVAGRSALRYVGGELPWRHPRGRQAVDAAVRAVAALDRATGDVRGFLGVDLVIGPDGPRVLEINPRLTSSYLGLRRSLGPGAGRRLCDAMLDPRSRLPPGTGAAVRFDATGRVRGAPSRRAVRS